VIALLEREATVLDPKHSRLEIGLKAQGSHSELEDPIATRIEPASQLTYGYTPPQPGPARERWDELPNRIAQMPQSHE
jgi:hypothetical protein